MRHPGQHHAMHTYEAFYVFFQTLDDVNAAVFFIRSENNKGTKGLNMTSVSRGTFHDGPAVTHADESWRDEMQRGRAPSRDEVETRPR